MAPILTIPKSKFLKFKSIKGSRLDPNKEYGIVPKFKFSEAGSGGDAILGELIKEGILDDVSSTEVRIKVHLNNNQDRIKEIAKDDFSKICSILEQSLYSIWEEVPTGEVYLSNAYNIMQKEWAQINAGEDFEKFWDFFQNYMLTRSALINLERLEKRYQSLSRIAELLEIPVWTVKRWKKTKKISKYHIHLLTMLYRHIPLSSIQLTPQQVIDRLIEWNERESWDKIAKELDIPKRTLLRWVKGNVTIGNGYLRILSSYFRDTPITNSALSSPHSSKPDFDGESFGFNN